MNHTIKGILIVVAITSMLVLGATTMVPILQNSFAHKKSDFKKAERDTNINVNRNSADSSSSSTATAENTNNINNTASATQSQEQSACAVAVTCPEGTTTVTLAPPTATCNPSTVGGQTATLSDGTCATAGATAEQIDVFDRECPGIVAVDIDTGARTCTFPSTPPT
jgi:hypothetical protein